MNTFPPALKVSIKSTDFIRKMNVAPVSILFSFSFFQIDDMHIYELLYLPSLPVHVYQKKFIIQTFLKVVFKL